jgi:hypothetical protein
MREVMRIKQLPAGFITPAQPVMSARPPCGADWVHEIKHDGYRLIVRRDGPSVRHMLSVIVLSQVRVSGIVSGMPNGRSFSATHLAKSFAIALSCASMAAEPERRRDCLRSSWGTAASTSLRTRRVPCRVR